MTIRLSLRIHEPRAGEKPFAPFAYVAPVAFSTGPDGTVALSPNLMTRKEIDETVDLLISDLEEIRKAGFKYFDR
jgi:hypothetical protein